MEVLLTPPDPDPLLSSFDSCWLPSFYSPGEAVAFSSTGGSTWEDSSADENKIVLAARETLSYLIVEECSNPFSATNEFLAFSYLLLNTTLASSSESWDRYRQAKNELKKGILFFLLFLAFTAYLLPEILQYLLLFCKFAEFPNRRRPKCTTMPWNIWPSLMVLWGVCWMFYPGPSRQDDIPVQFLWNDEYLPVYHPNLSSDFVPQAFPESFGESREIEDDFRWWNGVGFTNIEDIIDYEALADSNPDPRGRLNLLDQSFQEVATSLPNTNTRVDPASQAIVFQLDNAVDSMPAIPSLLADIIMLPQLNQNLPGNCSESNQVDGRSERAIQPTVMPFGPLPQQMPIQLQTPMMSTQAENRMLKADGQLICNEFGCGTIQFDRKWKWQAHMNKHTRPFLCEVEGDCPRKTSGFATKGERKRHNEAHARHNGDNNSSLFRCRVLGCPRTAALGNDGFSRKDQLREHMKRAHPGIPLPPDLIPRTAKVSKTLNLTALSESMDPNFVVPDMRKRKRKPANELGVGEPSANSGEDATPEQNLVEENERLKRQVKRLFGVIDSLTQQGM